MGKAESRNGLFFFPPSLGVNGLVFTEHHSYHGGLRGPRTPLVCRSGKTAMRHFALIKMVR